MNECLKWGRRFPTWSLFTLKASYLVEWLFSGWSFMLLCLLIAQNMKVSPVPCTNPKWTMRVTSMEKHKVEVNHPGCCTEMQTPTWNGLGDICLASGYKSKILVFLGVMMKQHLFSCQRIFQGWFTLWHKHKHKPTYADAVWCW